MELESALAGRDVTKILNNPRLLLRGNYGPVEADEFDLVEHVINSVMLDIFINDVSTHDVHYIFGGGGGGGGGGSRASSRSSSSRTTTRATALGAFAGTVAGGVMNGALSEVGSRMVSFFNR